MVTLEARLEGADEAIATLRGMGADLLDIVEPALQRGGYRSENKLKEYPSQRPTEYVRTMKLGQAWFMDPVVRSGDELLLNLGNRIGYAPYVQSQELQANVHRGYWETDEEILDQELPVVVEEMSAALNRAAGR